MELKNKNHFDMEWCIWGSICWNIQKNVLDIQNMFCGCIFFAMLQPYCCFSLKFLPSPTDYEKTADRGGG